jgi:hypothetical protein
MHKILASVRDWQIYLVIVIFGIIVYGKSITYGFTYADDTQLIVMNQDILSNYSNIPELFKTDVFISTTSPQIFYRPLLNVLFMVETHIAKDSPWIYHVTNILLHLGCCILMFKVLQRLGCTIQMAAMASLLFCVHPLNSSAVVWIPGQNDILLGAFLLASFLLFLQTLESRRWGSFIGHLLLFLGALLTKESAIVFPVLCISYALLFYRHTFRRRAWVLATISYCFVIIIWFVLRSLVPQPFTVHLKSDFLLASSLSNLPALFLYFGKVFFLNGLSIFPNLLDNSIWPGLVSMVLFVVIVLLKKPSSAKNILWGLGWFLLFLVPSLVSGIIFYEHRAYSAFLGLLLATVELPLVQIVDLSKIWHAFGFIAIIVVLVIVTMLHTEQYRNRSTYATSAYVSSPSIDNAYVGLAGLFIDEGNYGDAEGVLRKGLARLPNMKNAHRMLGDIFAHRSEYAKAAQEYETTLRLDPLQLYTYIMYGKMCLDAGHPNAALTLWQTSVRINPDYIMGYYYLANYYVHVKNDPDSAMIYAKQIQDRGETVLPELLQAIQQNPLYGKKKQ